jgi:purine nucleosidase
MRSSRQFVAVEHVSDLTRGYSLFDSRAARNAPNATVIDEIDAAGFFEAYKALLASGTRSA